MSTLVYDGHDFADLFAYGDPKFSILASKPVLEDVDGRNGQAFLGMTYGSSEVSFTIGLTGEPEARRGAFSSLGAWLMVDEPKPLYLPDTADRYYLAVPSGAVSVKRCVNSDIAQVTFKLTDPVAYGQEHTATLPSGGSVSFNVGGTAPTMPTITASSAVRDSTSLTWGVRLDSSAFVHVPTGSGSSRAVSVDCAERVCTVASSVTLPTLDSDWLVLTPGTHTLAMDYGTGAATVTWVERWY